MKEIINEQEVKKLNHYSTIYAVHFIVLLLSAVPLFMWLEWYALIPFGIFFAITMFWALKVEKSRKKMIYRRIRKLLRFVKVKN